MRMIKQGFLTGIFALPILFSPGASAALIGPNAYSSSADSPFNPGDYDYFYLEDVEDDAINTPGLTVTGPSICISGLNCFVGGGITDSVGNGGNGLLGRSIWTAGSAEITFSAAVLGSLPTAVGLVWTDGNNPITFEAFDQNGVSLGTLVGNHADGTFAATIGDDRFYGVTNAGGISRVTIANPPGTEIDHIQYGGLRNAVPEPETWSMMIAGFGLVGGALRRRGRSLVQA